MHRIEVVGGERAGLELGEGVELGDEQAEDAEHGNAAVLDLRFLCFVQMVRKLFGSMRIISKTGTSGLEDALVAIEWRCVKRQPEAREHRNYSRIPADQSQRSQPRSCRGWLVWREREPTRWARRWLLLRLRTPVGDGRIILQRS